MFTKGNELWRLADPAKVGRPPIFNTPAELWEKVSEYFEHIDTNPIETTEIYQSDSKGNTTKSNYYKKPYTWFGLYIYLGVCNLEYYKLKAEFSDILTHIDNCIRENKFTGASAGVFNANIIARDLGLVDKKEVEGSTIQINITEEESKL